MRKELELMETIDNYLKGKLSEGDKIAFEKKLATDKNLQQEVQLQKELLHGIKRTAIKQTAKKVFQKKKLAKNITRWGIGGLMILVVCAAIFYLNKSSETKPLSEKAIQKENVFASDAIHKDSSTIVYDTTASVVNKSAANSQDNFDKLFSVNNLKTQKFTINANRDTVIKSKSGVAMKIDKNTFVNKNGENVKGIVTIDFKEALTPTDIVMANLVTTTNGKSLESGGMIYTNATANGNKVNIASKKTIAVSVPAKQVKKDMQIYEGEKTGNVINWVNPKPIVNPANMFLLGKNKTTISRAMKDSVSIEPVVDATEDNIPNAEKANKNNSKNANVVNTPANKANNFNVGNANSFAVDNKLAYVFSLTNLGWANIDRLANDPRTKEIELNTKIENKTEFKYIYSRIMFPAKNMFIPGYEKKDGSYSFTHGDYENTRLPVGETAIIMATSYEGDKIFFDIKKITITEKQEVSLTLKETTDPEIKKIIMNNIAGKNNIPEKMELIFR